MGVGPFVSNLFVVVVVVGVVGIGSSSGSGSGSGSGSEWGDSSNRSNIPQGGPCWYATEHARSRNVLEQLWIPLSTGHEYPEQIVRP